MRGDSMTRETDNVLTALLPYLIGLRGLAGDLEADPDAQPVQVCRRAFDSSRETRHFDKGILVI